MATPEEKKSAASRRLTISSMAPAPKGYVSLGENYATLSIKVPSEMASAIAVNAAEQETSVSALLRSYIQTAIDSDGTTGKDPS